MWLIDYNVKCFNALLDSPCIWHRRLGQANMKLIQKLSMKDLTRGLPQLEHKKKVICDACQYDKQVKSLFKADNQISIN